MQRFHVRLRYQRGVLFSLLLCMLLGSLLGCQEKIVERYAVEIRELFEYHQIRERFSALPFGHRFIGIM